MSRGAPKRKLRIRRRRRHGGIAADIADGVDAAAGGEVVAQLGCCLVEAVTGATVLAALMIVPAYYLLS